MLSAVAFGFRGLIDRMSATLATISARHVAELAPTARLLSTGRVVNIGKRPGAVRIGERTVVGGQLQTFAHAGSISIGEWCFIGADSHIWSSAEIVIGNRVLISHGVNIHDTDSHPLDPVARFKQTEAIFTRGHPSDITTIRALPVRIGDDAWIGFGATIMKGVTIGDRAIVGANAIVRTDVPADGMVSASVDMPRSPQS